MCVRFPRAFEVGEEPRPQLAHVRSNFFANRASARTPNKHSTREGNSWKGNNDSSSFSSTNGVATPLHPAFRKIENSVELSTYHSSLRYLPCRGRCASRAFRFLLRRLSLLPVAVAAIVAVSFDMFVVFLLGRLSGRVPGNNMHHTKIHQDPRSKARMYGVSKGARCFLGIAAHAAEPTAGSMGGTESIDCFRR